VTFVGGNWRSFNGTVAGFMPVLGTNSVKKNGVNDGVSS
jgi:hypothetical protein